jgi:hypothetical protein
VAWLCNEGHLPNLAAVKFTMIQVAKLPLYDKISKIDMICFAKPGLMGELVSRAKGRTFSNMLEVRYVHMTKSRTCS